MPTNGTLYRLTFASGKTYLGITNDYSRRMKSHKSSAATNPQPLYRAIRKYGWDNVVKEKLAIGDYKYIKALEYQAIKSFNSRIPCGYNVAEGGASAPSSVKEVRAQISRSNTGKKMTVAQRARHSEMMRLRWQDPIYRAKVLIGTTGKKRSEFIRLKQSIVRLGMRFTSEHRANLSKAHAGKTVHGWSAESRLKASISRKKMLAEKALKK